MDKKTIDIGLALPDTWIMEFKIHCTHFAFFIKDIKEVIHIPKLFSPPGISPALKGFVNIERQAIPVLSLSVLFELPAAVLSVYTPVLIIKDKQELFGILVDEVLGVMHIVNQDILKIDPEKTVNNCIIGEIKKAHEKIHLLIPEKILLMEEKHRISEFKKQIESRLEKFEVSVDASGEVFGS